MTHAVTIAPVQKLLRDWLRGEPQITDEVGVDSSLAVPAIYAGGFPATAPTDATQIALFRVGGFVDGPLDRPLIQFDVVHPNNAEAAETAVMALISLLESTASGTSLGVGLDFMGASTETVLWLPDPATNQPRYVATVEITTRAA